jgi:osmotically-inducible protein OsmY
MKNILFQRELVAVFLLTVAFAAFEGGPDAAIPGNSHTPQKKNQPVSDDAMVDVVMLKLASDPIVKGGAIQVGAMQGVVTLSGTVETDKQKVKAGRLAKKVKGVKQVVNNLTVKQRAP